MSDLDLPDDLVQLERNAWEAAQRGELTAAQAAEVQAAITAHAEASGLDRYTVEMALKKTVRHPEAGA
ncbi:hypothetical protein [Streptomyces reticuli]|uniref:hypothetical protein n=1 Tax=Streptomyces reticuli TaxID=1926 RepID=UPI00073DF060|nr:hypothetical protein [Streptomyces sp. SID7810]CUW31809.1 hypothetical protein TUE45_06558 [Streptomyces reticuli]